MWNFVLHSHRIRQMRDRGDLLRWIGETDKRSNRMTETKAERQCVALVTYRLQKYNQRKMLKWFKYISKAITEDSGFDFALKLSYKDFFNFPSDMEFSAKPLNIHEFTKCVHSQILRWGYYLMWRVKGWKVDVLMRWYLGFECVAVLSTVFNLTLVSIIRLSNWMLWKATTAFKIPNLVLTDNFNFGQNKGSLISLSIIEEKLKFALLICFYLHARFPMPHSFSVRKPWTQTSFKTGANWCEIAARTLPHVSPGICKYCNSTRAWKITLSPPPAIPSRQQLRPHNRWPTVYRHLSSIKL